MSQSDPQSTPASPLLQLPGAVAGDGLDQSVAAHYGSFNNEQRQLVVGEGFVDLSHRDVFGISGPDRLGWLHSLTTQFFDGLEPNRWVSALILSPQGHVEHAFDGVDDGQRFVAHTEPGRASALLEYLERMRFMLRVEVATVPDLSTVWRPGDGFRFVPRPELGAFAEAAGPAAGLWAFEALRIARGEPRLGLDTDARTIPNEVGWLDSAVHLDKGCYRGQETVARVHNLGRPPRRLVMLHLDGSENVLPTAGTKLSWQGREIGFLGSSARHFEWGPIALGMVKRNVPIDAQLDAQGHPVAQEVIVDPDVGLHFRNRLGG